MDEGEIMGLEDQFLPYTKNVDFLFKKKIILNRLKISLTKIRDSIDVKIENEVQRVHFQVAEDTIYKHPDLINNQIQDKFFSIKNIIDTRTENLPLKEKKYKKDVEEILNLVEKQLNKSNRWNFFWKTLFWIFFLFCLFFLFGTGVKTYAEIKTNWPIAFSSLQKHEKINGNFAHLPDQNICLKELEILEGQYKVKEVKK